MKFNWIMLDVTKNSAKLIFIFVKFNYSSYRVIPFCLSRQFVYTLIDSLLIHYAWKAIFKFVLLSVSCLFSPIESFQRSDWRLRFNYRTSIPDAIGCDRTYHVKLFVLIRVELSFPHSFSLSYFSLYYTSFYFIFLISFQKIKSKY